MKKFVCTVCKHVHEAEFLPEDFRCPTCKVPAYKFEEVKSEMKPATKHAFAQQGDSHGKGFLSRTGGTL